MPINFRTRGATGQAPTTSFFGLVPDKYTMLVPAHVTNNGSSGDPYGIFQDTQFAAQLANSWTIFNTSFYGGSNAAALTLGSFTTGPDGSTNSAQHFTGTTTDSEHSISAGLFDRAPSGGQNVTYRFGVFAKAAEYTRIMLVLEDTEAFTTGINGCKTVFDLAGVQVGVANTAYGASGYATPGPTAIWSFGNGWCCCTMDVVINGNAVFGEITNTHNFLRAAIYLDAGSGTGSQDTTFTGNGTSGVYLWKTTILPPTAWAINNANVFRDDFTSLSTIDVNNTGDAGYNWYIQNFWAQVGYTYPPGGIPTSGYVVPSIKSQFTVNGSILTITPGPQSQLAMMTAFWNGSNGYVAQPNAVFQLPMLIETSYAYGTIPSNWAQGGPIYWTTSLEGLTDSTNSTSYVEADFSEAVGGGSAAQIPETTEHSNTPTDLVQEGGGGYFSILGYLQWYPGFEYNSAGDQIVYYQGSLYQAINGTNTNNPPSSSPSFWESYSIPSTSPTLANSMITDVTVQNLFAALWLPSYLDSNKIGHIITFFNGVFVNHFFYGPYQPPTTRGSAVYQVYDARHYPLMYGTANTGFPNTFIAIDYAAVSK